MHLPHVLMHCISEVERIFGKDVEEAIDAASAELETQVSGRVACIALIVREYSYASAPELSTRFDHLSL
jgi:hypothetical protein